MTKLYIAEAIEKQVHMLLCEDCDETDMCPICDYKELIDEILSAPTVDVEPIRHGHWMFSPDDSVGICSCCHYPIYGKPYNGHYLIVPYNYCPNCGARMDEEKE